MRVWNYKETTGNRQSPAVLCCWLEGLGGLVWVAMGMSVSRTKLVQPRVIDSCT